MAANGPFENQLADIFVNKAPKLPQGGKAALVKYLPWISLIVGLLTLYTAWVLWHWAHTVNALVNYANTLSQAFGGTNVASNRLSVGIWLGIIVLFVEGLFYLTAFPGLKSHSKSGWYMLYYGALLNIVYGVVVVFTSYGGIGNLIGSLIGSAIGFWLLFQIRDVYKGAAVPKAPVAPSAPTKTV